MCLIYLLGCYWATGRCGEHGGGAVNREESVSWGIRCMGAYLQKERQTMKEYAQ